MIKKFVICSYGVVIGTVDIERETEHSVWIKGSRSAKKTEWNSYFDSYNEAYDELELRLNRKIESAESSLSCKIDDLAKFKNKNKPK